MQVFFEQSVEKEKVLVQVFLASNLQKKEVPFRGINCGRGQEGAINLSPEYEQDMSLVYKIGNNALST